MRKLSLILLFAILIGSIFNVCSALDDNKDKAEKMTQIINKLQYDQKLTKEALQEVRRGQLNYRIAKDLLKDTYSSNTQTINIVIMIVLAVFTIIGFLGVKSVGSIKSNFQGELNELEKLREKYEQKFTKLDKLHNETEDKLKEIQNTNEKQDQRLQILEIQEKVGTLIQNKDYSRAMEYVEIGLSLDSKDNILLHGKAECSRSLFGIPVAIQCYEELIKIDPNDYIAINNITEFYLIERNVPKAKEVIEKYKQLMVKRESAFLVWYFDLVVLYLKDDLNSLKLHIDEEIIQLTEEKTNRIVGWRFNEIIKEFEKDNESALKSLFFTCIDFLEGKIDITALNEKKVQNADTA